MNKNFDISSMKNAMIILLMLIAFISILGKAFDLLESSKLKESKPFLLPEKIGELSYKPVEVNSPENSRDSEVDNTFEDKEKKTLVDEESFEANINRSASKKLDVDLSNYIDPSLRIEEVDDINNLPEIQQPKETLELIDTYKEQNGLLTPLDPFVNKRLKLAEQNAKNKNYVQAIKIYNDIAQDVDASANIKARCYDNIAKIYVIDKKYGLALKYAKMANETENTPERVNFISQFKYNKSGNNN